MTASDLDSWWARLRAAALIGTGRREPPWPDRLGIAAPQAASRDRTLLDAAALGDAVRRAGRRSDRVDAAVRTDAPAAGVRADPAAGHPTAPPAEPVAPPTAVQLLELLIGQRPLGEVGQALLLRHWVDCATVRQQVLPHRVLPAVLDLGTRRTDLRQLLAPVLGRRGRWLAGLNPIWAWATDRSAADQDGPATVAGLRRRDPVAALRVVESTWATDPARTRAVALRQLVVGLGAADEDLLERALDDRSAEVRTAAWDLLDRLPGSARARRMADRLRPLVTVRGALRRTVEVGLPPAPDDAAVRDGLTAPERGRSARAWWLHRIVAGSPLAVWTELLGTDPATAAALLAGEEGVRPALVEAATRRGDVEWCRALLAAGWAPQLAAALPTDEHQAALAERLRTSTLAESAHHLSQLAPPWTEQLSQAVVAAMRRDATAAHAIRLLRGELGLAVHPAVVPALQQLADEAKTADRLTLLRDLQVILRDTHQFHTLHESISEAFP